LIVDRNNNLQIIAAVSIAAAIAILAVVVFIRIKNTQSIANSGDSAASADDEAAIRAAEPIDPSKIGYREKGSFAVALDDVRAMAVDADNQIYVGGRHAVVRYSSDGKKLGEIPLAAEPRCLAVGVLDRGKPAQLYIGMEDHVEVYDPQGSRVAVWESCGPDAIFTSITTTEREVWVADAGNRLVWRFDAAGKRLKSVGRPDPSRQYAGFVVTSPYFDLAAGTDDLVYVVNPRLLHVESFTQDGEYEASWGKGTSSVADFFGCCNPAQLAVLPDGGFVTAEKGIPRVKVYSHGGQFQTVVAGPAQLTETPADLATDRRGRVLALEHRGAKVRIFETNSAVAEENK
jgi:hypothetical protein